MRDAEWFSVFQNQLLQLNAIDFVGIVTTPSALTPKCKRAVRTTHVPEHSKAWVTVDGGKKPLGSESREEEEYSPRSRLESRGCEGENGSADKDRNDFE